MDDNLSKVWPFRIETICQMALKSEKYLLMVLLSLLHNSSLNVRVWGWNPKVLPFKWKLLSGTFLSYCLLCCTRWFQLLSLEEILTCDHSDWKALEQYFLWFSCAWNAKVWLFTRKLLVFALCSAWCSSHISTDFPKWALLEITHWPSLIYSFYQLRFLFQLISDSAKYYKNTRRNN